MAARDRIARALPALLAAALFLALAAHQLELPGLHYDEAREAGLPAMQLLLGQPVSAQRDVTVALLGRELPLMAQDYIGALQAYLALPFLALFGVNAVALRLMPVALGALTVALAGRLAAQAYGPRAGWLAALLLAVQPSFLFWARQGVFVTSVVALLAVALLLLVIAAARSGRAAAWAAAAFVAGLGLYAKLLFVWLLGALAVVALAWMVATRAWRGEERVRRDREPRRDRELRRYGPAGLLSAAAFVLALSPLLIFNLRTGGTLTTLGGSLSRSYYGVDNLAYAHNLGVRLDNLRLLLSGGHFWYLGGPVESPAALWVYGAAALLLLAGLAAGAGAAWRRALLLPAALAIALLAPFADPLAAARPWAFVAGGAGLFGFLATERDLAARWRAAPLLAAWLIVLQSAFTISDLFVTHFVLLAPFLPLVVAATLGPWLAGSRRTAAVAALALALVLGASDLWTDVRYHELLARTGGLSQHSDAIYRLADELRARPEPAVALDWGFATQVQFLSAGAREPVEVFGYSAEADEAFAARLAPWLARPDTVFVFHSPQETVFARRAAFDALAAPAGVPTSAGSLARRDGAPVFELVVVQPR